MKLHYHSTMPIQYLVIHHHQYQFVVVLTVNTLLINSMKSITDYTYE